LLHSAKTDQCFAARFFGPHAAAKIVVGVELEVTVEFVGQLAIAPVPVEDGRQT
jgi:hypothetical protein